MDNELRDIVIRTETLVDAIHKTINQLPERLVVLEERYESHEEQDNTRFRDLKQEVKKNRSWLYVVVGVGLIGLGSTLGFADSIKLFVGI